MLDTYIKIVTALTSLSTLPLSLLGRLMQVVLVLVLIVLLAVVVVNAAVDQANQHPEVGQVSVRYTLHSSLLN